MRVTREFRVQVFHLRVLQVGQEIPKRRTESRVHRPQKLARGGFARGIGRAEGRFAPRDVERDVVRLHAELADGGGAEEKRLGRHLRVFVRRRVLVELRDDELGTERLGDGHQRRGGGTAKLHVRHLLRRARDHPSAVGFRKTGSLVRQRAQNLEHPAEHLKVLIVEPGNDGEASRDHLARVVRLRRGHRAHSLRRDAHPRQSPFPIAGLELLDSLRAKKRSHALDDLLLGRGRALAHFGVRGGGGERRRRRGTAR